MTKISVVTTVNADPEKAWEFWTSPKHIVHWNFASDDWHCPKAENDLRVGGKMKSRMEAKDGSVGFDFEGILMRSSPEIKLLTPWKTDVRPLRLLRMREVKQK